MKWKETEGQAGGIGNDGAADGGNVEASEEAGAVPSGIGPTETIAFAEAIDRHDDVDVDPDAVSEELVLWEERTVTEVLAEVRDYFAAAGGEFGASFPSVGTAGSATDDVPFETYFDPKGPSNDVPNCNPQPFDFRIYDAVYVVPGQATTIAYLVGIPSTESAP